MNSKTGEKSRSDWRGEQTRSQLIEIAESLFAREGIDSVSMRKIGVSIGSSNTNVVGYHFGSKEDLINAIFEHRLPWLDAQREALYQRCETAGTLDIQNLLHAFWWPLYQQKNTEGLHSYAGFLAELLRSGHGALRGAVRQDYPATEKIIASIRQLVPGMSNRFFDERLQISAAIVTTCLHSIDRRGANAVPAGQRKKLFADSLSMAAAALQAPTAARF